MEKVKMYFSFSTVLPSKRREIKGFIAIVSILNSGLAIRKILFDHCIIPARRFI